MVCNSCGLNHKKGFVDFIKRIFGIVDNSKDHYEDWGYKNLVFVKGVCKNGK